MEFYKLLVPCPFGQKNATVRVWFTEEEIHILRNQIFPKLFGFINESKRSVWEKLIGSFYPNHSYQKKTLLSVTPQLINQAIKNSILVLYNQVDDNEIDTIVDQFTRLYSNELIILDDKTNVYLCPAVIECFSYINSIKNIFILYPFVNSEHRGTAHRGSSQRKIIQNQIDYLKERLDHHYFSLLAEDEIKKTELQIRFLTMSLDNDHSNLPEYFNYVKINFGLDSGIANFTEHEQKVFDQLLNFYNGLKSSEQELLKSVMTFINYKFNNSELDAVSKANLIREIIRYIFPVEFNKIQRKQNKKIFYSDDVSKAFKIKTIFHDVPIFVVDNNKGKDFLEEFMTIGINAIVGVKSLFDSEAPSLEDAPMFHQLRNFIIFMTMMGFDKVERKIFYRLYFVGN